MPLIIEDGSQIPDADSYVSLDDADKYLVPRGLWPVTGVAVDTEAETEVPDAAMIERKETALRRGADYLNALQWKGQSVDWERIFAWPRIDVPIPIGRGFVPENKVPKAVIVACMEIAAVVFGGGNPLATVERGGAVLAESHSETRGGVDVIGGDSTSDSYTYAANAPAEPYYPQLRGAEPYLAVIPGKVRGVRVLEVGRG